MLAEVGMGSIILLLILLVLSAFFSGSEAALLSVQRIRIQNMVRQGAAGAARVAKLVESPDRLLPPILLGNNLVNVAVASVATAVAFTLIENQGVATWVSTVVVTVVLVIFGESIPKTIAAHHAERFAIVVAIPISWISWFLKPASYLLEALSSVFTRALRSGRASRATITEEEIKAMVSVGHQEGAVDPGEAEMIRRVLEFGDRYVREVMTPRPEIVWVEQGTTVRRFLELYSENYHTRFPVFQGKADNVVGLIAVKDVMRLLADGADFDASATIRVRPAMFVPETKRIQELFDEMRANGEQMTMIADEYGGVAGLVTLKRLVEDIVGKVDAEEVERGEPSQVVEVTSANSIELGGAVSISEANERLGISLPVGEYETVAGFILERLGRVPEIGDAITYENLTLTVTEMRGVRIAKVHLDRVPREV